MGRTSPFEWCVVLSAAARSRRATTFFSRAVLGEVGAVPSAGDAGREADGEAEAEVEVDSGRHRSLASASASASGRKEGTEASSATRVPTVICDCALAASR